MDAKLDELLKIDIIEEVSGGPSGRTSPLVVVSKGDSDVRVCVERALEIDTVVASGQRRSGATKSLIAEVSTDNTFGGKELEN